MGISGGSGISGGGGGGGGPFPRSDLIQEDEKAYSIDFRTLSNGDGEPINSADTLNSGTHYSILDAGVWKLFGNSPNSNTQNDASAHMFSMPPEYVAGQTITIRINAQFTAAGDTNTLSMQSVRTASDGTTGGNLVTTGTQTLTGSAVDHDFTINPATVGPGDRLLLLFETIFEDADGTVGEAQINSVSVLLDVKG